MQRNRAYAKIKGGTDAPLLRGYARFYQRVDGVLVVVNVTGLPSQNKKGFFGLHIHEGRVCDGEGFAGTGGHFNTAKLEHPLHEGDLPPLMSYSGKAYMAVITDRFMIRDIVGRTLVIHSDRDDFTTQPSGNAGTKIACGEIRMA